MKRTTGLSNLSKLSPRSKRMNSPSIEVLHDIVNNFVESGAMDEKSVSEIVRYGETHWQKLPKYKKFELLLSTLQNRANINYPKKIKRKDELVEQDINTMEQGESDGDGNADSEGEGEGGEKAYSEDVLNTPAVGSCCSAKRKPKPSCRPKSRKSSQKKRRKSNSCRPKKRPKSSCGRKKRKKLFSCPRRKATCGTLKKKNTCFA